LFRSVPVNKHYPLFVSHFELGGFLLVESGEEEVERALKKSLKKTRRGRGNPCIYHIKFILIVALISRLRLQERED
jgi:hypothetical protein